jgi:DNA-binding NarL/FixJ family response regulator
MIDVAVLEPREVLRWGLATISKRLKTIGRLECHRSLEELVEQCANGSRWKPDVVIVGHALAGATRSRFPATRVLEVIDSIEPCHLATAAEAKADGYLVMPDITEATLDRTLQALMRGELPIPRPVADYLLDRASSPDAPAYRFQRHYSPRERDVVSLLLDGRSNAQISQELGISLHSAKRHVSAVLNGVNSPSRAHFISSMLRHE